MVASPQKNPQVGRIVTGKFAVLELLHELHDLRVENRKLRRRITALEASRERWRDESRTWKWGALQWRARKSA